jgi:hypothetical protein
MKPAFHNTASEVICRLRSYTNRSNEMLRCDLKLLILHLVGYHLTNRQGYRMANGRNGQMDGASKNN